MLDSNSWSIRSARSEMHSGLFSNPNQYMTVVTFFLLIVNQTEFNLVRNQNDCDHIPFNLKGIGRRFQLVAEIALLLHANKSFLRLFKLGQISIVITFFRCIWHQTEFNLVPRDFHLVLNQLNQSEKCNYNKYLV